MVEPDYMRGGIDQLQRTMQISAEQPEDAELDEMATVMLDRGYGSKLDIISTEDPFRTDRSEISRLMSDRYTSDF
jgi:hypothetical protein